MEVLVTLRNRSSSHQGIGNPALNVVVKVDPEGTVKNITDALFTKTGTSGHKICFKVILCGKVLSGDTPISSLFLGPQTSLAALLVDAEEDQKGPKNGKSGMVARSAAASFQVFCKNCDSVKRGKLRVYCASCGSNSVLLKQDPTGWNDVLYSSVIPADCEECKKGVLVQFRFKCIQCGEVAVPLTHIRGVAGNSECCVCGEGISNVVVDLGCHHCTCLECFVALMVTSLSQQQFVLRPPYGYTLSCPMYNCDYCVTDPHHFYLLGKEKYEDFKTQAAEKYVSLENGGIFCPNPLCGAAFLWERDPDESKLFCPECRRTFCGNCRLEKCSCGESDATKAIIQTTCKKCPSCGAPTERNGGCTHMHCTHCNAHWCFVCVKPWGEDCQWNHWFD